MKVKVQQAIKVKEVPRVNDDDDIPTDINHGISIDSWIKDKLK